MPNHLSLFLTAPALVTNVKRAGDSWVAGGKIYQPISWDVPQGTEDNEIPEIYVVRYRKRISDTGTDNVMTNTTEVLLNLTFPLPQQAVTYIVSVAGKAGTERGNFSNFLILNYSSRCVCLPHGIACVWFNYILK